MIPREKTLKLIQIYMYICDLYQHKLQYIAQRFSNNHTLELTDPEVITVYRLAGCCRVNRQADH